MRYIEKTNKLIKDYFNILSPNYPEWLNEYIETERMLKQQYISVTCGKIYSNGKIYSKLFDYNDYSSLAHSIAVALIIWNFTHDKKQTLSNDLIVFKTNTLEEIKEIYNDIDIQVNENGIIELGFKTKKIARKFVKNTYRLSVCYRDDATRFYMQAIADILRKVSTDGLIGI